jgi:hypothetical protein
VLVIGSGYHRQILGGVESPLGSWRELLRGVAERHGLRDEPLCYSNPTEAWERLVVAHGARRGGPPAAESELTLKKTAASLLEEGVRKFAAKYADNRMHRALAEYLGNGGIQLISLNFDDASYRALVKKDGRRGQVGRPQVRFWGSEVRTEDEHLLFRRMIIPAKNGAASFVWHPHGLCKRPGSLRLGLRDYGVLPACYVRAFNEFKAWERTVLGRRTKKHRPIGSADYRVLLKALAEMDAGALGKTEACADTWVTRFMLLPVTFIGAGLSTHEIGLRWLLAQRARNLARVTGVEEAQIVTADRCVPLGAAEIGLESWDEAWAYALKS